MAFVSGPGKLPPLKDFVGPAPREAAPPPQTPGEMVSAALQWAALGVGEVTRH